LLEPLDLADFTDLDETTDLVDFDLTMAVLAGAVVIFGSAFLALVTELDFVTFLGL